MPLDPEVERAVSPGDRFDDAVAGGGHDLEVAGVLERLAMMTVDGAGDLAFDLVLGAVPVEVGGGQMVGEVLVEAAARAQSHELHPEADAQQRQARPGLLHQLQPFQLACLSIRRHEGGLRVDRLAEGCGVGIVAAAQDQRVEAGEDRRGGSRHRRQRDSDAAGGLDRPEIGASDADLILHEIAGDAHEGAVGGDAGVGVVVGHREGSVQGAGQRAGTDLHLGWRPNDPGRSPPTRHRAGSGGSMQEDLVMIAAVGYDLRFVVASTGIGATAAEGGIHDPSGPSRPTTGRPTMTQFQTAPTIPTKIGSDGKEYIDYKSVEELRRMLTPNGKIYTRKRLGADAREQRRIAQAVKRARYMGLLPYTSATL